MSVKRGGQEWRRLCVALTAILAFATHAGGQEKSAGGGAKPLVLTEAIPLGHVKGRIDHIATDGGGRLFISALGNNSVEVIEVGARTVEHTIAGVPEPQGVAYSPAAKKLFVGSGKGLLYIYDGSTFALISSIDFRGDVDNLRYDSTSERVYVGYGEDQAGAIGTVDAATNRRLDEEYKLGAHPESFQLESAGPNIFVNLPNLRQIAAINRKTQAISRWPLKLESNFPMALEEADHRLFVATHAPARLAVLDTASGEVVATLPCVQDADDLFYDATRKRIYVPGGEGYISVFQQADADHYRALAEVPSALGARTAGYFGKGRKGFDRFYLAVPARADRGAELWIYTVQD